MATAVRPVPADVYPEIEEEFLADTDVTLDGPGARDEFVQLYNDTIGHYLTCDHGGRTFDRERYLRYAKAHVHIIAYELRKKYPPRSVGETTSPTGEQLREVAIEVMQKAHTKYCTANADLPACKGDPQRAERMSDLRATRPEFTSCAQVLGLMI